jgi:hypothetical protein
MRKKTEEKGKKLKQEQIIDNIVNKNRILNEKEDKRKKF